MVSSMLVVPVAASLLVSRSFKGTMVLAVVFALVSVAVGLLTSFYLDLAPGGTIVLTSVILLLAAIAAKNILKLQ
jgi:zinc transport system permease protein